MNKVILLLVLFLIPLASAIQLPTGVDGTIFEESTPAKAYIKIQGLNSSFFVEGYSDDSGWYSAALPPNEYVRITAELNNKLVSKEFLVVGLHHENLAFDTTKTLSEVESSSNPSVALFKVNNVLTTNQKVRVISGNKDYGWKNLDDFPDKQFSVVVYDTTKITVLADGKEYSKTINPGEEIIFEEITVVNNGNLAIVIVLILSLLILLWVKKG